MSSAIEKEATPSITATARHPVISFLYIFISLVYGETPFCNRLEKPALCFCKYNQAIAVN
jgi:hypothetical protein